MPNYYIMTNFHYKVTTFSTTVQYCITFINLYHLKMKIIYNFAARRYDKPHRINNQFWQRRTLFHHFLIFTARHSHIKKGQ